MNYKLAFALGLIAPITCGNVERRNLWAFDGEYIAVNVDKLGASDKIIQFEKGDFPLVSSVRYDDDSIGGAGLASHSIHLTTDIKAWSFVDIVYLFPAVSVTDTTYTHISYNLNIMSNGSSLHELQYNEDNTKEFVHRSSMMLDDCVAETVCDASGIVIGMKIRCTVACDVDRIGLTTVIWGMPEYRPFYGTITTTYQHYDNFVLNIRSGGSEPASAAHLYNDVKLPKLPKWNKSDYPYALIAPMYGWPEEYRLFIFAERPYVQADGDVDDWRVVTKDDSEYFEYQADKNCISWYFNYRTSFNYFFDIIDPPLWANFDVLHEDGTLFLSASEPILVYE